MFGDLRRSTSVMFGFGVSCLFLALRSTLVSAEEAVRCLRCIIGKEGRVFSTNYKLKKSFSAVTSSFFLRARTSTRIT
jgi:hypothetical protein